MRYTLLCWLLGSSVLANDYVRFQGTEFLTYDELVSLSTNPLPDGELKEKMDRFFSTPIISNEAWFDGQRRVPQQHPQLGDHLRIASWNIEKSFQIERAADYLDSAEAYEKQIPSYTLDLKGKRTTMLRQQRRIAGADVLIVQEMDIGVSRSGYVDAARVLATRLNMNYAYAPAQLEVDPVLLGLENLTNAAGKVIESFEIEKERYKGVFGSAILSRYPIKKVICFPLKTQPYDWYTEETNLPNVVEGGKRFATKALFKNYTKRELKAGGGRPFFRVDLHVPGLPEDTLTVINVHLEIKCPPSGREAQMVEILSYIKDLKSHVILMGDYNSSSVDISPTSLKQIGLSLASDKSNWLSGLVTLLTPQSTAINSARRVGNTFKNFQDPLAPNIPVVLPNKVKPMFDRIGDFRFEDGGVFDCRGDAVRSISGVQRPLANSNHRSRYKGFRPSFSVKRPIGLVGQQRLDWAFIKRAKRFEGMEEGPYQFAPHFGETLYEFNCGLIDGPISDHSPNILYLPFAEPDFSESRADHYLPIRYEEDWGHIAHPVDTIDLTLSDRLKCRPLGGSHDNTYTLGWNTRLRYLSRDLGPDLADDVFEYQGRFYGDLHLASGFRFYVEGFSSTISDPDPAGLSAPEESLDLLNAFGEYTTGGTSLRLGRQMFELGAGRLLSINPWTASPRSWDGFALEQRGDFGELKLFGGWLVEVDKDGFNESTDDDALLGLSYALNNGVGAYLLATDQADRNSELATAGFTFDGQLAGFDLSAEIALQAGEVEQADLLASMVAAEAGYIFRDVTTQPRPWLGVDFTSGDGDRNDGDMGTFQALYGDTHRYLGTADVVGRGNLIDLSQGITLAPNGETSCSLSHHWLMRLEDGDAVYSANGAAYDATALSDGTHIGNEFDLNYRFRFNPSWRVDLGAAYLIPGDVFTDDRERHTFYCQMEWIY